MAAEPRTPAQIEWAIEALQANSGLTYSYREDCIAVLCWCMGGEPFDGLPPAEGAAYMHPHRGATTIGPMPNSQLTPPSGHPSQEGISSQAASLQTPHS